MKKKIVFLSITLAFILGIASCRKKVDEEELENAQNMTNGFTAMMTNVGALSYYSGSSPWPWLVLLQEDGAWSEEQAVFYVPEGNETIYYYCKIPISAVEDTLLFLVRLTPDVHPDSTEGVVVTLVDGWLLWIVQDDIWWHLLINSDGPNPPYVYGTLTWHYDEVLWTFTYFKSMENESLDATVETDITYAAQFLLDENGEGDPEDNWGTYHDERFIQYTFFAEPDADSNDGYYELASEDWEEEHYFKIQFNLKHEY